MSEETLIEKLNCETLKQQEPITPSDERIDITIGLDMWNENAGDKGRTRPQPITQVEQADPVPYTDTVMSLSSDELSHEARAAKRLKFTLVENLGNKRNVGILEQRLPEKAEAIKCYDDKIERMERLQHPKENGTALVCTTHENVGDNMVEDGSAVGGENTETLEDVNQLEMEEANEIDVMRLGDEDRKTHTGSDYICLKVIHQVNEYGDGNEVIFRMKRSMQLQKLMKAYCDRQDVDINSIVFLFDGRRIPGEQTPYELEMKEADEIDVMWLRDEDRKLTPAVICLKVIHQVNEYGRMGTKLFFRMKRSMQLQTLMKAYCDRQDVDINSIDFLFDGQCIRGEQTPCELKMKEADEIVAMRPRDPKKMSGGGVDRKPNTGGDDINLKVKAKDGNEVSFRMKRSMQLQKLMKAYCDRQDVDINSIVFLFDGQRIRGEQTPCELDMEEADEIDVMEWMNRCFASSKLRGT